MQRALFKLTCTQTALPCNNSVKLTKYKFGLFTVIDNIAQCECANRC